MGFKHPHTNKVTYTNKQRIAWNALVLLSSVTKIQAFMGSRCETCVASIKHSWLMAINASLEGMNNIKPLNEYQYCKLARTYM